jgi:outer membrane biosynthesis protein TonB
LGHVTVEQATTRIHHDEAPNKHKKTLRISLLRSHNLQNNISTATMQSKIVAITAIAALAEQAFAYNHNRHTHKMHKKALDVVWETVFETVYVTAGQEPPAATEPVVDSVLPTITSTSVVVIPSSAAPAAPIVEAPVVEAPKVEAPKVEAPAVQAPPAVAAPPAPPAPATTLTTAIAPKPTEAAPVVEKPAVAAPQPEQPKQEEKPKVEEAPKTEEQPAVVENPVVEKKPENSNKEQTSPKPSGGSASFSPKRGMAYNSAEMANSFHSACKNCRWAYNWGSSPSDLDPSISYVPMCWGEKAFGHWAQDAEAALAAGSKALLSFNEPDHVDQANMSPAQAAAFHKQYLNPYSGKAKIGSPAVTNGGGEMGLTWLKNFFNACDAQEGGCAVDFCAIHWYSEAQYADTLLEHIKQAHEICGRRPVWLTEFAPLGDDTQKAAFMKDMIPKLDAIDYLEAYSYFWVDTSSLMSSLSSVSSIGQIYATI